MALEVLKVRLADAGLAHCEGRFELIGVNSVYPWRSIAPGEAEPAEVRARIALRVPTRKDAQRVANEVEALYLNGPSGGGGVTQSVREVIAVASTLVPRTWITPRVTILEL